MAEKSSGIFIGLGALAAVGVLGLLGYFVLHPQLPFPKLDEETARRASTQINIDVYIDGSESMRQFLANANGLQASGASVPSDMNYLHDLLLNLGGRLKTQGKHVSGSEEWSNPTVCFWKFGDFGGARPPSASSECTAPGGPDVSEIPLAAERVRELAEGPQAQFVAHKTPIERPISAQQGGSYESKLKIIITDLYQTSGRPEEYFTPLANRYLDRDTDAIAILAVRNRFAGPVDDLPQCGRALSNAADTMPFYVIVAGPVQDVRKAEEVLKGADGLSDAIGYGQVQEWFFSKSPGTMVYDAPVVRVRNPRYKPNDARSQEWIDLKEFNTLHRPSVAVAEGDGPTELTIHQGQMVELSWPMSTLEKDPLHADTLSQTQTTIEGKRVIRGKTGTTDDPTSAVTRSQSCKGSTPLCFVIDDAGLQRRTNDSFFFKLIAHAGEAPPKELEPSSSTMQRWNIEEQAAQNMCRSSSAVFPHADGVKGLHPGMTPQLRQFLRTLQDKMLNSPVTIATYPLHVKAR